MKKIISMLLFVFSCSSAYSLPVGNPAEAGLFCNGIFWGGPCNDPCDPCFCWFDAWSFRLGYYGDFVKNRNLKFRGDGFGKGRHMRETEITTHAAYLALNICDLIDVFSTLGASNLIIRTNETSFTPSAPVISDSSLFTDTHFSWSVGARASLVQWRCFVVGLEGQYFQANLNFDHFVNGISNRLTYFNDNNNSTYKEWQVGLGLSYKVTTVCPNLAIVPYVAGKYSNVRYCTRNFQFASDGQGIFTLFNLKANKHWGCALGTTFTFCDRFGVTLEGRFGDEKAYYVNGQFCF